ncbi:GATA zinc finger domain-containing protein 14-like isoform X2 [Drosophila innubila]|uniref:GATA zinc finger domain-containing protein 14-like isoform X2 n=1 Tax=Drosophila innubila TaxID=198719 RepID=UPI00148B3996|nr:GATA zinc finger domain-containing protein 14-like isoform X2 [Drosophila innubila]
MKSALCALFTILIAATATADHDIIIRGHCVNCVTKRPSVEYTSGDQGNDRTGPQQGYDNSRHGLGYDHARPQQGYDNSRPQQGHVNYEQSQPQPVYGNNYNDPQNRLRPGYNNNYNTAATGQTYNPNNWRSSGQNNYGKTYHTNPHFGVQRGYSNNNLNTQGNSYRNAAQPNYGNTYTNSAFAPTNAFPETTINGARKRVAEVPNNLNSAATGQTDNQAADTKPYSVPQVFSGYLPDGTYLHNGVCTNCRIELSSKK